MLKCIVAKSFKSESLGDAVDLIVVLALGKGQQFGFELRGVLRKINVTARADA